MTDPLEAACTKLLNHLESSPLRPQLDATPARVARTWRELTSGYGEDPLKIALDGVFPSAETGLVALRGISLFSMCEHHLLPFIGHCHVAFLPGGTLIGFSKVVRVVSAFARRLQVQERLSEQIADVLEEALRPKGLAVIVEAQHLCMVARGVRQEQATVRTAVLRGVFRTDPASQQWLWGTVGREDE
jgi:GTP cyclohydrolase I